MRLAWVTCAPLPEPDHDEGIALAAFREVGVDTTVVAWNTPADWSSYDIALLRSCWNYYENAEAFLTWVQQTSAVTRMINPADVIAWNADKSYLFAMEQAGIPIVPTSRDIRPEWNEFVIKPSVSAGSFMTRRFTSESISEARPFMEQVARHSAPIVQPYIRSVDDEGERSIMWIAGTFTHGIRKSPRFSDQDESVSEAYAPSEEELDIAGSAMAFAGPGIHYARIDVMRRDDGVLGVSELELIEPSLFLKQHPPALDWLVRSILQLD